MITFGIDPSTKFTAISVFEDDKFKEVVKIKSDIKVLNDFFGKYKNEDYIVCIETQYVSVNAASTIKLVEARSMIATIALLNNCKGVININPNKWQSEILNVSNRTKRKIRKELSKKMASINAEMEIKDSDMADAINIGFYYVLYGEVK